MVALFPCSRVLPWPGFSESFDQSQHRRSLPISAILAWIEQLSGDSFVLKISFILPVLNEAVMVVEQLQRLQPYRRLGHELVVVDGGSQDQTLSQASSLADIAVSSPAGRGRQMNRGAELASGEVLLFLHVDTVLPAAAASRIEAACGAGSVINSAKKTADDVAGFRWGWFDVRLSNPAWSYRMIARSMNLRARMTSVCTGDQAMFVQRQLFDEVGGFPQLPLMEDVAMSKILRRVAKPRCIADAVETSSRRWEANGLFRTMLLMWQLRLLFFLGVSPSRLVKRYYPERQPN